MKRRIGILTLSGPDYHTAVIESLGHEAVPVKRLHDLDDIEGLIISGKGSAWNACLPPSFEVSSWEAKIERLAAKDLPIFGFGSGMVMLAKEVLAPSPYHLPLMDITVLPDALGNPGRGMMASVFVPALGKALLSAVFIQAPYAATVAPNVGILAEYEQKIVFVRQGNLLAVSFHPMYTSETRLHRYFLDMVDDYCHP